MEPISLLRALVFAADKHRNQQRKGAEASPYINHLIAVAAVLAEAGVVDETLLIAAILHNTIEDTKTTYAELESAFGPEVADLVREVTDDKSLDKAVRKQLQIQNAGARSDAAKQLKIADKISNIRDLTHFPPADWTLERHREYLSPPSPHGRTVASAGLTRSTLQTNRVANGHPGFFCATSLVPRGCRRHRL